MIDFDDFEGFDEEDDFDDPEKEDLDTYRGLTNKKISSISGQLKQPYLEFGNFL